MPSDTLQNLVDTIDTDAIRNGDQLALVDALTRIHRGLNDAVTNLAQLRQQAALTPLYCRLYRGATTQTIPDATETFLSWETPPVVGDIVHGVNVGGMFDPADTIPTSPFTGDHYVLLREPGLYLLEAYVRWDTNVIGDRQMNIALLGSFDSVARDHKPASITSSTGLRQRATSVVPWRALASSTGGWDGRVGVRVLQSSGGDRTVGGLGGLDDHWFTVTRIGAIR